jgi:alpha-L-fucosidase
MSHSFGFNRNDTEADYATAESLIADFVDGVAKNGNLLLNVGPMADGTIPGAQVDRLQAIGAWLGVNGEAISGTRPWTRAEGLTGDGTPVRFTARSDGSAVYAAVLGSLPAGEVTLVGVGGGWDEVRLLGSGGALSTVASAGDLHIQLPPAAPTEAVYVFELRPR